MGDDNGSEASPCSMGCTLAGNMVFVTSESFQGKIGGGGVKAADGACMNAAAKAQIANAGGFRAWISDGEHSPSNWNPPPKGPFILPDATIIATSWAQLTSGQLAAPIDVFETGENVDELPYFAWTGTNTDGAATEDRCSDWSTTSKPHKGTWGSLTQKGMGWTVHSTIECQQFARLICIEQ